MSKEVNTVIGKTVGYLGDFYIVGKGEEETRLTKEEFETVKLPELSQREQKYYDEIKESEKGGQKKDGIGRSSRRYERRLCFCIHG